MCHSVFLRALFLVAIFGILVTCDLVAGVWTPTYSPHYNIA
jgi:hypothetical protein